MFGSGTVNKNRKTIIYFLIIKFITSLSYKHLNIRRKDNHSWLVLQMKNTDRVFWITNIA